MSTVVTIWAGVAFAMVIGLAVAARRIGRARSAAWLVVLGLVLVALEEPLLTFWLGLSGRQGDPDGIASSVTPMARAHVLDAGISGAAAAVLLGWIAMTPLRRGGAWARRVLAGGAALAGAARSRATLLLFSRRACGPC